MSNTKDAKGDAEFLAEVTAWAQGYYRDAEIVVTEVRAHGSDWGGSTEGGFYSYFKVTLYGSRSRGRALFDDIEGEAMESLWKFVVAGFRSPEATREPAAARHN